MNPCVRLAQPHPRATCSRKGRASLVADRGCNYTYYCVNPLMCPVCLLAAYMPRFASVLANFRALRFALDWPTNSSGAVVSPLPLTSSHSVV